MGLAPLESRRSAMASVMPLERTEAFGGRDKQMWNGSRRRKREEGEGASL